MAFSPTPGIAIRYINAPAGAGKTEVLANLAAARAKEGSKVLLVQRTIDLIEKTRQRKAFAPENGVRHRAITSDDTSAVLATINHEIDHAPDGVVLFITHRAFRLLKREGLARGWHLIVDEILDVISAFEEFLPETHHELTNHIKAVESPVEGFSYLVPSDISRVRAIARNERGDKAWSLLADIANPIDSPHWRVYAHTENYRKLLDKQDDTRRMVAYSILQPSLLGLFESVIIAGANFTESLLFNIWKNEGVEFVEADDLKGGLRSTEARGGEHLTINFLIPTHWSKTLGKEAIDGSGKTVRDEIISKVKDTLGGVPFLWMGNNDLEDGIFSDCDQACRLPGSPHGFNDYQNYRHVVVISALNPSSPQIAFLKALSLTSERIKAGIYYDAVYQAVMRCGVRDPENVESKHVYLVDQPAAEWLHGHIPGSGIKKLDWLPEHVGKPKKSGPQRRYGSPKERVAAQTRREEEACQQESTEPVPQRTDEASSGRVAKRRSESR